MSEGCYYVAHEDKYKDRNLRSILLLLCKSADPELPPGSLCSALPEMTICQHVVQRGRRMIRAK